MIYFFFTSGIQGTWFIVVLCSADHPSGDKERFSWQKLPAGWWSVVQYLEIELWILLSKRYRKWMHSPDFGGEFLLLISRITNNNFVIQVPVLRAGCKNKLKPEIPSEILCFFLVREKSIAQSFRTRTFSWVQIGQSREPEIPRCCDVGHLAIVMSPICGQTFNIDRLRTLKDGNIVDFGSQPNVCYVCFESLYVCLTHINQLNAT